MVPLRCRATSTQVSFTSCNVLRQISHLSGNLATLFCGENQVVTTLVHLSDNDEKTVPMIDDKEPVIFINVLTAANLEFDVTTEEGHVEESVGQVSTLNRAVPPAGKATLRLWGRPLPPPSLDLQTITSQNDDLLPLPPAETLLKRGLLIAVPHHDEIYFYEVLQVDGYDLDERRDQQGQHKLIYKGTCQTRYRISTGGQSTPCPPQLPPFGPIHRWVGYKHRDYVPHPDVDAVVAAWSLPADTATPAAVRVRHVVGSESDHHVSTLIQAAADRLGCRLIIVPGLAFYAYWNQKSVNYSGSLADKLAGLEAALEDAARHEPCILLLLNIDRELSVHDKPVRHDEESRIWSLLMDHLSSTSAVMVVLSSTMLLSAGPLTQGLVFASITCTLPGEPYTRHLWKAPDSHENSGLLPSANQVLELLLGRTAREIVELRDDLIVELASSGERKPNKVVATLEELCTKRDEERRRKSGGADRIPSVHWEDIGGLSHVRREIMDAIELPLQYPHLFPKASSRSGILLYGPPGCGKTLVAKAVATECSLPFSSIKGPELLGSYVGESEAHVRAVFENARQLARQNKPPACVLFFDELDSLAPRRGMNDSGGHVMDRVVATFFTELDKDSGDGSSIFVIGATNRPDLLDPSLLRPGRFDRLVYLGVNPSNRAHIVATQIRKLCLEGDPNVLSSELVKSLPESLTGADLSTIASGAQLLATERLCTQADEELARLHREGETEIAMDQLLDSWEADRLKPAVTFDDLLNASKTILPSVNAAELEKYNRLKDQFSRSSTP